MTYNLFDFLISKHGNPIVYVDIKNPLRLSKEAARQRHEHIFKEYGFSNSPKYFLLVSQDHGYLWNPLNTHSSRNPDLEFPMTEIVTRYFKEYTPDLRLRHNELAIIIYNWLSDLTMSLLAVPLVNESEKSLSNIGFLDAIQGATIITEDEI